MKNARILPGILGTILVVSIICYMPNIGISIILAVICGLALFEYNKCIRGKDIYTLDWLSYTGTLLPLCINYIPQDKLAIAVLAYLFFILLSSFFVIVFSNMKYNVFDLAITVFGILYIAFPIMFISLVANDVQNGRLALIYLFGIGWISDTFAYFIGVRFGKTKLCPKISPKKSVEGSIGGFLGAMLVALIFTYIVNKVFGYRINYLYIEILTFVAVALSQFGDLTASSIKRSCNVKDYSNLIPGHGGILDRFDSLLLISPIIYVFFMIFPII